jgi:hypothetical protein
VEAKKLKGKKKAGAEEVEMMVCHSTFWVVKEGVLIVRRMHRRLRKNPTPRWTRAMPRKQKRRR